MEQQEVEKKIAEIVQALSDAGYDPHAQLTGYLQSSDTTFITRKGNARALIQLLDKEQIANYVCKHFKR